MVFVRKKYGKLRLAQDFRSLNKITRFCAYNLSNIDVLIDSLKGSKYFASLDLFAGYHQVKVEESHQERTAFNAGPFGFYHYSRLPFGLSGAPATFQRLMDKVLEGLNTKICQVYLDDVIVHAVSPEELYERLDQIFQRFRAANLRLKPSKCKFLQRSVDFLGHTVSEAGIECKKEHIEAVVSWPVPHDIKSLQSFLGFTNFFRRYVQGYASIMEPLLELLRGHSTHVKKGKHRKKPIPKPWHWGHRQSEAFAKIKSALTSTPVLEYPDFEKEFVIHVDASRTGLGAVLFQKSEGGKLKVLSYGSKSLGATEKNYSAHKLEFLALKWAITQKFSYYLLGKPFVVYTDHNPLVYLLTTAKLDATGHRWLSDLSRYQFQIFYRPGRRNQAADALSRRPDPEAHQQECVSQISQEVFQELCTMLTSEGFTGLAETFAAKPEVLVSASAVAVGTIDWKEEQQKDPVLRRVIQIVQKGRKPLPYTRRKELREVSRILQHWDSLMFHQGVLCKKAESEEGPIHRVIVPSQLQQHVLKLSHDDMGHLGRDKTLSIAKDRYFWIGLADSIEQKIRHCPRCIRAKTHLTERAPLCSITSTRPLEIVCMDFLGLETSKGGCCNILVVTDHYTKYARAYPTRNQDAKTVAKLLVDDFIVNYGIPERLHSDQGGSFENRIISHMCKLLGMSKSKTTPYHPMGDGITERFNRTLLSMLRTLEPDQKMDWKAHVPALVHAYNCTRHESTGYSPFYLMFGRVPRLPVDVFLGMEENYSGTVKSVKENLEAAYKAASAASREAAKKQSKYYNRKVRGNKVEVGDLVLVKNVGLKGKHKLADKWKQEIHVIVEQPNPEIPVYKVGLEKGEGVVRTLHRNLLLPLALPLPASTGVVGPKLVKKSKVRPAVCDIEVSDVSDESSNDDTEIYIVMSPDISSPTVMSSDHAPRSATRRSSVAEVGGEDNKEKTPEKLGTESVSVTSGLEDPILSPVVSERGEEEQEEVPRRSQRERKAPDRYKAGIFQTSVATMKEWSSRFDEFKLRLQITLELLKMYPQQQGLIDTVCMLLRGGVNSI